MKNITKSKLLVACFVLCLACSKVSDIKVKNAQPNSYAAPRDSTNKGSASARLFVYQSYSVVNQWAPAQWTYKGDFNGDKLWDVISLNGTQAFVKLSQGTNASSYVSQTWVTDGRYSNQAGYTWVGDFNGDGYSDIASAIGGIVYMKINNHNGAFSSQTWSESNNWGSPGFTVVGDFNKDGKTDIASANGSNTYMYLSTGSGFQSVNWPTNGQWGTNNWTFAGDFNGDGKIDIASIDPTNGIIYLKQNTGNGFTSSIGYTETGLWGTSGNWAGDTNGDGKAEIIGGDVQRIYVRTCDPKNGWQMIPWFSENKWGSLGGSGYSNFSYNFVEDFDGDGTDEVVSCIGGQIYAH